MDEQIGNLVLTGCRHDYDTYIPGAFASIGRSWLAGYPRIGSYVRDTRAQISNYSGGQLDLYTSTVEAGAESHQQALIDGVSVVGAAVRRALTISVGDGVVSPLNIFKIRNLDADLSAGVVVYNSGNGQGRAEIELEGVTNTGPIPAPLIFGGTGPLIRLSASVCHGLAGAAHGDPDLQRYPVATSISSIVAEERMGRYGKICPLSYDLADGEQVALPAGSFANNSGIIMVGVGHGASTAQAIIALGNSGPALMSAGSTGWAVGGTSEPAGPGLYKCWSGPTGTIIKNISGASRVFTILMLG